MHPDTLARRRIVDEGAAGPYLRWAYWPPPPSLSPNSPSAQRDGGGVLGKNYGVSQGVSAGVVGKALPRVGG